MSRLALAVAATVVVGVLSGLWLAARAGVSSEQRLADAEPPSAAVAEAELEERVLEDVVTVRGRVEVQSELPVHGAEAPSEGRSVVVDLPVEVGDEVGNGDVVAVVADRPVMVLEMPVPLWRTLRPNDEGPDVERFQEALSALGYPVVADGAFGPATQDAVREWYRSRGFDPEEMLLEAGPGDEAGDELGQGEGPGSEAGSDAGEDAADLDDGSGEGDAQEAESADEPAMGVVVPMGEVAGVRALPATVTDLPSPVGSEVVESPVAVLSPSENVIRAEVEPGRAALLTPGTTGTAEIDGARESYSVEVILDSGDAAGENPMAEGGSPGGGGGGEEEFGGPQPIVFASEEELLSDLVGSGARVEVTASSTEGPVLAAPVTAIRTDADGDYLLIPGEDERDGEPVRVGITAGASIGGWVEVIDPERDLEAGASVLLGGG